MERLKAARGGRLQNLLPKRQCRRLTFDLSSSSSPAWSSALARDDDDRGGARARPRAPALGALHPGPRRRAAHVAAPRKLYRARSRLYLSRCLQVKRNRIKSLLNAMSMRFATFYQALQDLRTSHVKTSENPTQIRQHRRKSRRNVACCSVIFMKNAGWKDKDGETLLTCWVWNRAKL